MKIKKRLVISLLLAASLLLGACGTSGTTPTETAKETQEETEAEETQAQETTAAEETSSEVTDITIWTKDRHDQELMTALFDKFNEDNPDINVIYEMYTDNYQQTVEIAAGTNELPDLLVLVQPIVDSLLARDMLVMLEDYMTPEFRARFDESLFMEGINMADGEIFALPNTGNTLRLVYNQDIFERVGLSDPPASLAELVDYSKKITDELSSEGIFGFALPLKNPRSGLQRGFVAIPSLSGYPINNEGFDFSQGKYDFAPYKPVVEAFEEIWSSGAAFPGCESLEIDPLRTQFADGKIGMYMTYSHSEWGVYTDQFPTDQSWQYAMLPTIEGKIEGSQSISTGFWYSMTSACDDLDKGWRVLEAIYSEENLVDYYEQGFGVSVLSSVKEAAQTPQSVSEVPYMGLHENDKVWPKGPASIAQEGDDFGQVFGSIIFGSGADLDAAIEDLNTRYNAAYEKAIEDGIEVLISYPNFSASDPAGTVG